MEIVTWIMQGSLVHQDSTGHSGVIYPGLAQRMSAGRGILHSEKNDSWRPQGEAHTEHPHHQLLRRPARGTPPAGTVGPAAEAPYLHLFVPRGAVTLEGAGGLAAGDAVRLTATGGRRVTATEPAEVLVWEMHATIAA